ncbi:hypothetical protein COX85_03240 [Candidatus Micrarchaeota archaeon CG_4_10_14_0_2_um_filter_55_9]|nr:MAG: hypothetical protein AUJ15_02960 [Candidatus Micrarchaeota archaeon CG1_02_55_41]PIZ91557.1 MAG: hypothetical protein COX85_03240 [Candidatus Micrarchaeota archaeon CG_4_10_14_0_2_um_filter_55_9]PJD01173.1 MAG: hypothetical protein COU38_02415 [Candidatus Micrarchaeota archaeon CG10_big_fil_rev_8_21_14_0_10_54_18]
MTLALVKLRKALEESWSCETAFKPKKWDSKRPSSGQCGVTALLVNDFFGGSILKAEAEVGGEKISHFYNELDGLSVDLTADQFPFGTRLTLLGYRSREELLECNAERYSLLKSRVESRI